MLSQVECDELEALGEVTPEEAVEYSLLNVQYLRDVFAGFNQHTVARAIDTGAMPIVYYAIPSTKQ